MRNKNFLVSIIIPTRNRGYILKKTLNSLFNQDYPKDKMEIIIIDDASKDNTSYIVNSFKSKFKYLSYLKNSVPSGANFSRNRGIEVANGEILVFIDDDVIAPKNWLKKLTSFLKKKEVITGPVIFKGERYLLGKHGEFSSFLTHVEKPVRTAYGEIIPVFANMGTYKEVLKSSLLDPVLRPPVEEIDWFLKVRPKVRFCEELWVWHYKKREELKLSKLLKIAYKRGSETGWYYRERLKINKKEKIKLCIRSLETFFRSLLHSLLKECTGGLIIAISEIAVFLSILGFINFKKRKIESWR